MSRRPTPTAIKKLTGNPGHRPLNDKELVVEPGAPEMPKGMSKAAQREWEFIVPVLLELGVLTQVDGKALAGYCDAYALWEQARKDINKYGLVVESPKLNMGVPVIIGGQQEAVIDPKTGEPTGQTHWVGGEALIELKANPAVSIYNTMGKAMKMFLIEFGLTPASRAKLKIEPRKQKNPDEEFFRNGRTAAEVAANPATAFDTGKPGLPGIAPAIGAIPDSSMDFDA